MSDSMWDVLTGNQEHDRRNVRALLESVRELYGRQAPAELQRRVVDRAISVTGAERGMLFLVGEDEQLRAAVARKGGADVPLDMPHSGTVVNKVWSSGKSFHTVDTAEASQSSLSASIVALKLLSVMAVPLPVKGKVAGVLYVDSTARSREFTDADMTVFEVLGGMVAVAVENARLLGEEEKKQRYEEELRIAQLIQTQLFPRKLPQGPDFQIAAVGRPCEETSGDYYDVLQLKNGNVALVVGDVSGHGVGPALLTSSTRALLHSYVHMGMDLVQVVENLNQFFVRDAPDDKFMTFFVGMFDPRSRQLRFVSAGHNPPLIWVAARDEVVSLKPSGPALGFLDEAVYALQMTDPLEPGDVVLAYTDGLTEARNQAGDYWGDDAMMRVFVEQAKGGGTADDILTGVLRTVDQYVGDQPWEDDVTGWVLRAS